MSLDLHLVLVMSDPDSIGLYGTVGSYHSSEIHWSESSLKRIPSNELSYKSTFATMHFRTKDIALVQFVPKLLEIKILISLFCA